MLREHESSFPYCRLSVGLLISGAGGVWACRSQDCQQHMSENNSFSCLLRWSSVVQVCVILSAVTVEVQQPLRLHALCNINFSDTLIASVPMHPLVGSPRSRRSRKSAHLTAVQPDTHESVAVRHSLSLATHMHFH